MGYFVKIYSFSPTGEIRDSVPVSFVQKGIEIEPCISVGGNNSDEIIFTRGSYEMYMEKGRVKSLDFSYVSNGFLFKGAGFWSLIPLTEEQCPKEQHRLMVVFKNSMNFEGRVQYKLENNLYMQEVISGFKGRFNESVILLSPDRILKVTFNGKNKKTYYLFFDSKNLKILNWRELIPLVIRRITKKFS